MKPTPVKIPGGGNSYGWGMRSVIRRNDVTSGLLAETKSPIPPMWKGGLPTTIDVVGTKSAEEQEMIRIVVVATWNGPISVFCAIGLTLE